MEVVCIVSEEERFALLKPVVQLSLIHGVSQGILYNCLYIIISQFIYCNKSVNILDEHPPCAIPATFK